MIYQQQTVAADVPTMRVETAAAVHGLSSSYFCAPAAEMVDSADWVTAATAAALS